MAIPLNINGSVFEYPEDFDEDWGVAATGWAQAVTNGMLQMQGGSFPLTADVNFGPNFGLLSKYFETRSSNPATLGTIRLASVDPGIAWRNSANNANLILTTDVSDNLLFQGQVLVTNGYSPTFASLTLTSPLTVPNGGTGDISFTPYAVLTGGTTSTSPVQAVAGVGIAGQVLASNGPGTLPSFQTVSGTGTINPSNTGYIAQYLTNGTTLYGNSALRFSSGGGGNDLLLESSGTTHFFINTNSLGDPELIFSNNSFTDAVAMDGATGDLELNAGAQFLRLTRVGNIFDVLVVQNMNNNRIKLVGTPTTSGDAAQYPITASQIANATITSTQIASGAVRGSTANSGGSAQEVSQGTVSTPDFRTNAVSQFLEVSGDGGGHSISGFTVVDSIVITSIGKPILFGGNLNLGVTQSGGVITWTFAVWKQGASVALPGAFGTYQTTAQVGGSQDHTITLNASDTPVAGTNTYNIGYIVTVGSSPVVENYNFRAVELRA